MQTFGDKLRAERESRDTRIQDVSERTRINPRYLEALENNDFDALPGPRGFGKLYIRAYAEMLGFDAQPLIEAFDEEQNKRRRAELGKPANKTPRTPRTPRATQAMRTQYTAPPEQVSEPPTEVQPELLGPEIVMASRVAREPVSSGGRRLLLIALGAIAILVLAGVALIPKSQSPASGQSNAAAPDAASAPPEIAADSPELPATASLHSPDSEPSVPAVTERAAAPVPAKELAPTPEVIPGILSVTEFGVGDSVVDRRIVGPGTRFKEGTSVAFLTRVVGGVPGQKIRHAWLREGRVVESIELSLGGAHWRTHSNKMLWGQGNWSVEARDGKGQVLARADFVCEAP